MRMPSLRRLHTQRLRRERGGTNLVSAILGKDLTEKERHLTRLTAESVWLNLAGLHHLTQELTRRPEAKTRQRKP